MSKKTCFVVSPIGSARSDIRNRSDTLLEYIIKPALEGSDYDSPIRVDKLDAPNHITTDIINYLVKADLVIADLSDSNPNVYYEVGIRHARGLPCIMLSNWEPKPPFDVSGTNIIQYEAASPTSHNEAIERIKNQLKIIGNGEAVSNPVTVAHGFSQISESGDDKDKLIADLYKQVASLNASVSHLEQDMNSSRYPDNPYAERLMRDSHGRKLFFGEDEEEKSSSIFVKNYRGTPKR